MMRSARPSVRPEGAAVRAAKCEQLRPLQQSPFRILEQNKEKKEVLSGTALLELDIVLKLFRSENLQKVFIENSKYRRGKTTL